MNTDAKRRGAVASPHWAATAAGQEVLFDGGNALDAAIATNAMLAVVYPHMCGVGGDAFFLYYDARSGEVHCLNGSGPSPALATREAFLGRGLAEVPARGPLSVTVPGTVRAWDAMLKRFGSRPLRALLEPAIATARAGFEVTGGLAEWMAAHTSELAADPSLARAFLDGEGRALPAGATMRLPRLATTLNRLASNGAGDFYDGELAAELVAAVQAAGGLLRAEDLRGFEPEWTRPLGLSYRGLDVLTTPPNSQGVTSLLMLRAMARDPRVQGQPAEFVQALVTAKRSAFAIRDAYITDPAHMSIAADALLSHDLDGVAGTVSPPIGGDTVYVCTVDGEGNACSLIQSIYYGFGSAFVCGETGVLLHNRAHSFSLEPQHPNCLRPGGRPLHTLMACMALENGRLRYVFGTMGADGQPQTNVQVLHHLLAGAHPSDAVAAPRVLHGRFVLEDDEDVLHVEGSFDPETIDALAEAHLSIDVLEAGSDRFGHAHAIACGDDGTVAAGADPRSDAHR